MGIESYIANLSMNMSQANTSYQASVSMLKKTMDSSEEVANKMIEQMKAMPTPLNEKGGLLDIYV